MILPKAVPATFAWLSVQLVYPPSALPYFPSKDTACSSQKHSSYWPKTSRPRCDYYCQATRSQQTSRPSVPSSHWTCLLLTSWNPSILCLRPAIEWYLGNFPLNSVSSQHCRFQSRLLDESGVPRPLTIQKELPVEKVLRVDLSHDHRYTQLCLQLAVIWARKAWRYWEQSSRWIWL